MKTLGLAAALAALLSACQALPAIDAVQPWEKDSLAKSTMKAAGPMPALGKIDQHIYTSKEAIKGGNGVGGGGCGCN